MTGIRLGQRVRPCVGQILRQDAAATTEGRLATSSCNHNSQTQWDWRIRPIPHARDRWHGPDCYRNRPSATMSDHQRPPATIWRLPFSRRQAHRSGMSKPEIGIQNSESRSRTSEGGVEYLRAIYGPAGSGDARPATDFSQPSQPFETSTPALP